MAIRTSLPAKNNVEPCANQTDVSVCVCSYSGSSFLFTRSIACMCACLFYSAMRACVPSVAVCVCRIEVFIQLVASVIKWIVCLCFIGVSAVGCSSVQLAIGMNGAFYILRPNMCCTDQVYPILIVVSFVTVSMDVL